MAIACIEGLASIPELDDVVRVDAVLWPCLAAPMAVLVHGFASASCPTDDLGTPGDECRRVVDGFHDLWRRPDGAGVGGTDERTESAQGSPPVRSFGVVATQHPAVAKAHHGPTSSSCRLFGGAPDARDWEALRAPQGTRRSPRAAIAGKPVTGQQSLRGPKRAALSTRSIFRESRGQIRGLV